MTGRRFSTDRPIRLSDADTAGRLRHDSIARYLQDIAADDVLDAGWAPDEHIWVVRRTVLEVVQPFVSDTSVELTTWCGAVAGSAAARRTTLVGDRGGHLEAEMIWIQLGPDLQPQRLGERFLSIYGASAEGRRASTRLALPGPTSGAVAAPWRLRRTDVDQLGHINNAAYWPPVEELYAERLREPHRAVLEYRQPLDLGDALELRHDGERAWFVVGGDVRAAAAILPPR
ncbi:MAG TPA: acyl-ACP thioesterase domain-containing protein [Gaiellaceae bacterium]